MTTATQSETGAPPKAAAAEMQAKAPKTPEAPKGGAKESEPPRDPKGEDAASLLDTLTPTDPPGDLLGILGDDTAIEDLKTPAGDGEIDPYDAIRSKADALIKHPAKMSPADLLGMQDVIPQLRPPDQIAVLDSIGGAEDTNLKITLSDGSTRGVSLDDPKGDDGFPNRVLHELTDKGGTFDQENLAESLKRRVGEMAKEKQEALDRKARDQARNAREAQTSGKVEGSAATSGETQTKATNNQGQEQDADAVNATRAAEQPAAAPAPAEPAHVEAPPPASAPNPEPAGETEPRLIDPAAADAKSARQMEADIAYRKDQEAKAKKDSADESRTFGPTQRSVDSALGRNTPETLPAATAVEEPPEGAANDEVQREIPGSTPQVEQPAAPDPSTDDPAKSKHGNNTEQDILSKNRDEPWTYEEMQEFYKRQSEIRQQNHEEAQRIRQEEYERAKKQRSIDYQEYHRSRAEALAQGGIAAADAYSHDIAASDPNGVGRIAARKTAEKPTPVADATLSLSETHQTEQPAAVVAINPDLHQVVPTNKLGTPDNVVPLTPAGEADDGNRPGIVQQITTEQVRPAPQPEPADTQTTAEIYSFDNKRKMTPAEISQLQDSHTIAAETPTTAAEPQTENPAEPPAEQPQAPEIEESAKLSQADRRALLSGVVRTHVQNHNLDSDGVTAGVTAYVDTILAGGEPEFNTHLPLLGADTNNDRYSGLKNPKAQFMLDKVDDLITRIRDGEEPTGDDRKVIIGANIDNKNRYPEKNRTGEEVEARANDFIAVIKNGDQAQEAPSETQSAAAASPEPTAGASLPDALKQAVHGTRTGPVDETNADSGVLAAEALYAKLAAASSAPAEPTTETAPAGGGSAHTDSRATGHEPIGEPVGEPTGEPVGEPGEQTNAPEAKEPLTAEQQALVDAGKIGEKLTTMGYDDEGFNKMVDTLLTYADNPQALHNIQTQLEELKDPDKAKAFAAKLAEGGAKPTTGETGTTTPDSPAETDSTPKTPEQIQKEQQIKTMAEIGRTISKEEDSVKQNEILDHIARNPASAGEASRILKAYYENPQAQQQTALAEIQSIEDKIAKVDQDKNLTQEQKEERIGFWRGLATLVGIAAVGIVTVGTKGLSAER